MARDRQRAKQRKARRAGQNPGPTPSEPHRANVPGELEHAGESDEFDAALVAGAGGRPAEADADAGEADADPREDPSLDEDPIAADEAYDEAELEDDELLEDEEEDDDDRALAEEAAAAGPRRTPAPARRAEAPGRGGPGRFIAFLRASWAELQRVQWPDRRAVFQATAVVLGFVVVAGLYLGIADRVAQEVVDFII
jgi:preprotein translocase subunit SecE